MSLCWSLTDVGVIWDMDGTLVASATVVPDAFIETVTRLGGTPPDRAGVVALYDLGDPRAMLGPDARPSGHRGTMPTCTTRCCAG